MTFSIIHDLDNLTEVQRKAYADSVAEHFGLDASMNPFDFLWMTQDSGFRKLCLYARRGTTDILRDKHQISVISLVQHDGPSYVSFTATGRNPAGRQEIAVGSCFTDNLKGEALAHAVMTAQTRALRRMTLQFAGVGILDVSEVNAPAETEQKITTPFGLTPTPVVPISHEPGKDITPYKVVDTCSADGSVMGVKIVPMVAPAPFSSGSIIPEQTQKQAVDNLVRVAEENRQKALAKLNEETKPAEPVAEVKKPRKPRGPNKKKVDFGPSEVPVAVQPAVEKLEPVAAVATPVQETVTATPVTVQEILAPPPVSTKPRLTMEQVKPFRQRLFAVVHDHLEPAGFAPKEGMGNPDKIRLFATMMFPDLTNMNELDKEQWNKFLTLLETKLEKEGAAATSKYIEDTIGF